MGRRHREDTPTPEEAPPAAPAVSQGPVDLPLVTRRPRHEVGVGRVRRPVATGERKMRPAAVGEASELFPGGGKAFEAWCASQGVDPRERRTAPEFQALLEEFARRPIHGHRRTGQGGNHRPNKKDLR